ncbi:MAG: RNA methyltransferase [Parcubacteria group bacterium]|nr:RNA methyltransferase [Parcubacteria group bacterium]
MLVSMKKIVLILHNIRSTYNVGAIFRTADGAGVSHVYLSGYTPLPVDQFNRPRKDIAKTALGAEVSVPWTATKNISTLISRLKKDGYTIVGLEQDERSVDYRSVPKKEKVALLVGNEVRGISPPLRKKCDVLIEIPMRGEKESLNVSVATGIALYAVKH